MPDELIPRADTAASVLDDGSDLLRRKALLKTAALQIAILKSAYFSIIATDEKGIIQLFNTGAERMLGYAASEVIDKISPSDIHDPLEVRARAIALSRELGTSILPGFEALVYKASRGIEDNYEVTCIRKDGSRFPAVISVTALHDDTGLIIGYLLIGTDNSVRKQVQIELTKAKASAEAANQAKSDFLSNMSHELRSPLNAILGFAQLLESEAIPLSVTQQESTSQILHAGWYLLDLINEILDLAQVESGKLALSQEPMSLDEVLEDCRTMIEPQAQKSGIAMTVSGLAKPAFVRADRTRVKQVFINLLSNAIKYNHRGGSVVMYCEKKGPDFIRISVKDSGPGISAEHLAQLFQPFNRLGQEVNGEPGTGIGLVMTKRLIGLMGGVIGVESTVGTGSVFWVELQCAEEPVAVAVASAPLAEPQAKLSSVSGMSTLLYVEDNPANLKLVEQLIARRANLRLLGASDASAGIRLARKYQPEVILMDINLPGISGISALKILLEDPLTKAIPILAISANAMPHDVRKGLEAGFFRYLTKPIKVKEFMQALDVALEISKIRTADGRV